MKNLFNSISQEEKNRILEMHSGKKNTISEQSVVGAPNMGVISKPTSSYKVNATVEDDMVMEFPVVKFHYGSGGVDMVIKDYDGKLLNVHNSGTEFKGPIFDIQSGKKKYTDSIFPDINTKNWKTIAKQHNIPMIEVMV